MLLVQYVNKVSLLLCHNHSTNILKTPCSKYPPKSVNCIYPVSETAFDKAQGKCRYVGTPTFARWFFMASACHCSWPMRRSADLGSDSFSGSPCSLSWFCAEPIPRMLDTLIQPSSPSNTRSCIAALMPPYGPAHNTRTHTHT